MHRWSIDTLQGKCFWCTWCTEKC